MMKSRRGAPTNRGPDRTRVNRQIRVPQIRVIGPAGEQLGLMTPDEGRDIASEHGLDLVEVAGDAKPPVCRIMDFGKFNYEKKKRQTKNKSHQTKLKEIRVRPKTGEHDIGFKVKKAIGFL